MFLNWTHCLLLKGYSLTWLVVKMRSPIALRLNCAFARWPGTKARRNQGGIAGWWNWPQAGSEIRNIITIGTCQYPAKSDRWQPRKPSNSNINSHQSVECVEAIKLTFAIAPKWKERLREEDTYLSKPKIAVKMIRYLPEIGFRFKLVAVAISIFIPTFKNGYNFFCLPDPRAILL